MNSHSPIHYLPLKYSSLYSGSCTREMWYRWKNNAKPETKRKVVTPGVNKQS